MVPIAHFVIFTFLSCPPNFLWQEFLEERFPGYNGEKKLNLRNTLVKFAVDQTLGATANTVTFVAAMSAFKGKSRTGILHDCQKVVRALEDRRKMVLSLIPPGFLPSSEIRVETLAGRLVVQLRRCASPPTHRGQQSCGAVLGNLSQSRGGGTPSSRKGDTNLRGFNGFATRVHA